MAFLYSFVYTTSWLERNFKVLELTVFFVYENVFYCGHIRECWLFIVANGISSRVHNRQRLYIVLCSIEFEKILVALDKISKLNVSFITCNTFDDFHYW